MKINLLHISFRTTALIVLYFSSTQYLLAQATSRKLNGGNEFDYGNCIIQTPDKGICIVGSTNSFGSGNYDVYVIRLDSNYAQQWSKTFDWGKNEYGSSVVYTKDNGIAITGYCTSSQFYDSLCDGFVLKLNANGKPLWCKSVGGSKAEDLNGIIETKKGELIAAGSTRSYGSGLNDIYITKLSADGALIWTKTLGTTNEDIAYSITETNKGFAVCGMSGNFLPFVANCDSNGNALWSRSIAANNSGSGVFNSIIKTNDNGFALTGYTSTSKSGYDVFTTKLTSKGAEQWSVRVGNSGDDKGNAIIQDKNGNYIINGYANYARRGFLQSLYLIKLNTTGSLIWNKTITEETDAIGTSVCRSRENAYIVTGSAWKTANGYLYKPDIYLAKFDTLGTICGISTADNDLRTVSPYISNLNCISSNGGALTDNIVNTSSGGDFTELCSGVATGKLMESPAKESSQVQQPVPANSFKIKLLQNPVNNGMLTLQYNTGVHKNMQFSLVNMQGKIVYAKKVLFSPQSGIVKIDINTCKKGYYLLNMSDGITQQSIKFMKAN